MNSPTNSGSNEILPFFLLLGVIGLATLLTFAPSQTNPLLIDWIAKALGIAEAARIAQLEKSFPFAIVQSLLLVVVFYLTVNLYHRALYVLRNYRITEAMQKANVTKRVLLATRYVLEKREGYDWVSFNSRIAVNAR